MPEDNTSTTPQSLLFYTFVFLICAGVLAMWYQREWSILLFLRIVTGSLLIIFSTYKLITLEEFIDSFQQYDVIAKQERTYATIYPFITLALGGAYLIDIESVMVNIAALIITGVGLVGVIKSMRTDTKSHTDQTSSLLHIPFIRMSLIENSITTASAVLMLVFTLL